MPETMAKSNHSIISMKIDAHQHFWQYDPVDYAWISEEMHIIRKDFGPRELQSVQLATGFDGSIAVQARQSLAETHYLLDLADAFSQIKGVVGWVDLRSEKLEQVLAELSVHAKFVGVRHVLQDESPEFMLNPNFMRGIGMLKAFDLTYDLLLFPQHLPAAIRLVEAFPEQAFVLDHIAKPLIKTGQLEPWKRDIQRLAQFPNVCCKLSGMLTEADWKGWKTQDFAPYIDIVWEAFGEDRLMIGSDWPVCLLAGSYADTMGLVQAYLDGVPSSTQAKILGENCLRFYGISPTL